MPRIQKVALCINAGAVVMPPNRQALALLTVAEEDLSAARKLCEPLPRQAAFHVGQAAEKLVRAVLLQEGVHDIGRHHQIDLMIERLPLDSEWLAELSDFADFAAYNTRFRYPGPSGNLAEPPTAETLKANIRDITALLPEVQEWVSVK